MSNSSLICYKQISPNKTSPRNHVIDTLTIHCMAGNISIENCGGIFSEASRKASANYGIGSDGRIALYVEEKDRSWCSSNRENDNRAVTIEVANDGGAETGWHISDAAYQSLVNLCADICQRNGIKELKWQGNRSLIGQVDKQNMTVHRWFASKACPGDYLYNLHGQIAAEVNARLKGGKKADTPAQHAHKSGQNGRKLTVGSTVRLKYGAKSYTGKGLAPYVYERNHQIKSIDGGRVVITYEGTVVAAVRLEDLTFVE